VFVPLQRRSWDVPVLLEDALGVAEREQVDPTLMTGSDMSDGATVVTRKRRLEVEVRSFDLSVEVSP
jgi:hypothetical protein